MLKLITGLLGFVFLVGVNAQAIGNSLEGIWEETSSSVTSSAGFKELRTSFLKIESGKIQRINLIGKQTGSIYNSEYFLVNDHQFKEIGENNNWIIFDYKIEGDKMSLFLAGTGLYGQYKKIPALPPILQGNHYAPMLEKRIVTSINNSDIKEIALLKRLPIDYEGITVYTVLVGETAKGPIFAQVEMVLAKDNTEDPASYAGYVHFFQGNNEWLPELGKPSQTFYFNQKGSFDYSVNEPTLGRIDFKLSWKLLTDQ